MASLRLGPVLCLPPTPTKRDGVSLRGPESLNANGPPGKDLAEVDWFRAQTDAAATGEHDGFIVERRVEVGESGVRRKGRLIELGGIFHVPSLVRALVTEDRDEVIEAGLLGQEMSHGGLACFFLQGEGHAFVASVVLGRAGLDAFDPNAPAQPPAGPFAEMEEGRSGSEGGAVVAAQVGGQAGLLKEPF